jgi:hypothetical protein
VLWQHAAPLNLLRTVYTIRKREKHGSAADAPLPQSAEHPLEPQEYCSVASSLFCLDVFLLSLLFFLFTLCHCNTPFYLLRTVYTVRKKRKTQHNNHLLFLLLFLSAFFVFSFLSCFCSFFFLVRCRFPLPLSAATPGPQHYPSTFEG